MNKEKRNLMIMVLSVLAFFANGDNYAVAPLLINISKDLNISIGSAALSVTAYMLAFGLFTIIFGPLGDRYGKTRVINIAAFGTAIFSMLGAVSFNLQSLIVFRAINGAFAAGIFPVTMALVGESFESSNRQKAIGKVMGVMFLGGASATAIGGALAYFGSWRIVYFIYGLAELIIAFVMLKVLPSSSSVIDTLNFTKVYKAAFSNKNLVKIVATIFLMGFSVFGSFTYSGKLVESRTGYSVLVVGLILTVYGIATVIGGRKAPVLREKLKNKFLLFAGIIGSFSLFIIAYMNNFIYITIGLFGFGLSFVFLQSTLVTTAQETMPKLRGTAMSLASFNMFVGGGIGTFVNGKIINITSIGQIFAIAGVIMLIVGIIATKVVFKQKDSGESFQA
ncbi:MFS transporter [Clostridium polyendosporum]|uniref:MFS transporter n=1 Tax=Clostridium polyendosporum TaxID=69208 RepID=A0A919RXH0_9CLOT|nr:MFS transporter [Clostridium polyendosporum]GIM27574.1 MFS transporter [Clostridium polyendosporum]